MTDFLNKIINIAKSAQSDRIINQAAKEKRDRLLPSFTTYQGIDPKDGTDKVMINGETNSGFNLISNASLSIGERVFLRPNQSGGLQRVDARNVAPVPIDAPEPPIPDPIFFNIFPFGEGFAATYIVDTVDVSLETSIGGSNFSVGYYVSDASLIGVPLEILPVTDSPLDEDYLVGTGTIVGNNTTSPYLTYKVDFSEVTNCFIRPSSGAAVSISSDDWAARPSITLELKGYAALDNGSFSLITTLTHEFTELDPVAPSVLFPDFFECNILEWYVTWEFV